MDFKQAVSEKGGGIDEKRMEDFLDCVRRVDYGGIFVLCNRIGNGGVERYDKRPVPVWDWLGKRRRRRQIQIHETFSGVTEIDMELAAGMVEFVEGDGGEIRVDTENLSRRLGFKCYMDGNELKLTSKKRFSGVNNIGRGKITVQIPRDLVFEEVSLSMGAGNLTVGQICCKELSVEIGAGEVNIDKFQADDAEFECGAGSITARGDVKSSADIHCGVGSIVYTASGREEEYNYDIQCGVGEVVCGDDTYSGLGKDRHIDNNADKDISIEGGVGSVIIDFDADRSR